MRITEQAQVEIIIRRLNRMPLAAQARSIIALLGDEGPRTIRRAALERHLRHVRTRQLQMESPRRRRK